jgi:hypothetical protein
MPECTGYRAGPRDFKKDDDAPYQGFAGHIAADNNGFRVQEFRPRCRWTVERAIHAGYDVRGIPGSMPDDPGNRIIQKEKDKGFLVLAGFASFFSTYHSFCKFQ